MEKQKEPKPNKARPGNIIRAAIAEALEYGQGIRRPLDHEIECSGDWDVIIGIGAMAAENAILEP